MKKKPPPKKARKKPAPKLSPDAARAVRALEDIERKLISQGAAIAGIGGMLANRYTQSSEIRPLIHEMGNALSDQIHLLVKCIPPNKGNVLEMRLEQLERRVALLEKEATYTVRHVIERPPSREETREQIYEASESTPESDDSVADPESQYRSDD